MRAFPLLVLVPLVAAACGGSSPKAGTTQSSVAQFVKAANQVCIRSDRRISRLGLLGRAPGGWAKTAAAARLGIAEMRAVKPPPSRRANYDQMMVYAGQLAAKIQAVHDELVRNNLGNAGDAQIAATHILDHVHAQAKLAGLTFCQETLTDWPA